MLVPNNNSLRPTRAAYSGKVRKLVLAFDLGTTFSGVSYSVLDPGLVPEIKGVNRYPAQENSGGSSKIPTVILYDRSGAVKACGAEAVSDLMQEKKAEQEWFEARLFKLHLRPNAKKTSSVDEAIQPLPPNTTALDVFADFFRYLFQCARTYFQETHANGEEMWRSFEDNIDYVLSHPNGWEGAQQANMRLAAVRAGLISERPGDNQRVRFVTEGEASLHFCIHNGLATEGLQGTGGVLIVDAGGGTIDISAYARVNLNKPNDDEFQEVATAQCHFKGSIFVTREARVFLENHLKGSRFLEDIDFMEKSFDQSAKLRFRNKTEPSFIKFGSPRDRDASVNILTGQLKLPGETVAGFFEPSVACIVSSVREQVKHSKVPITSLFLVGGFAASDWLFASVKEGLKANDINLNICRPDGHVNKAVSDGAISFYLDHSVTARISKAYYGMDISAPFDPSNPQHSSRMHKVRRSVAGQYVVDGYFKVILEKGVQTTEKREFKKSFITKHPSKATCTEFKAEIWCYGGDGENPEWFDVDAANYRRLCTVSVDLTNSKHRLLEQKGTKATKIWFEAEFEVILLFGLTELQAQIGWKDQGVEQRSPARIVFEDY